MAKYILYFIYTLFIVCVACSYYCTAKIYINLYFRQGANTVEISKKQPKQANK